jgi:hypothetical protein
VQIETFLDGLYNDDSSQLYHGFTNEMKVVMRNSFMCDKEFYNSVIANIGSFPMEEIAYQRLTSYVTTARQFTDLHPERNKFPPHEPRKPPTLNQWKRTKIGRRYADSAQSSRGRNTSVLREMLMSRLGSGVDGQVQGTRVEEKVGNAPYCVGMVEVDSGIEVMKIAYSSDIDERDDDSVNLKNSLMITTFSKSQLEKIQKPFVHLLLPKIGLNRHTPLAVVHGPIFQGVLEL